MNCISNPASFFYLIMLLLIPWGVQGKTDVLVDKPNRLEFMLTPEGFQTREESQSLSISCSGCISSSISGSADLPYMPINIIGDEIKAVQIKVLGSTLYKSTYELQSVPFHKGPHELSYKKNKVLYKQAGAPKHILGPVQKVRNIPTRTILIPVASWSENNKQVNLRDSIQVTIIFNNRNKNQKANSGQMPQNFLRGYLNPLGGRFINPTQTQRAKSANPANNPANNMQSRLKRSPPNLNKDLVKIAIGDRDPGELQEDGIYKLTFETLKSFMQSNGGGQWILGNPINSIRMYTGEEKKLSETMPELPGSGDLTEIPIEVVDVEKDGTFDEGDYILFFGHGTGVYNRVYWDSTAAFPVHYEFESNPYSFYHHYYLDFKGSGLRLSSKSSENSKGRRVQFNYSYLRKEKDKLLGSCDDSNRVDRETGRNWYWVLIDNEICSSSRAVSINMSAGQMEYQKDMLVGLEEGSATYFGFYTNTQVPSNNFKLSFGDSSATSLASPYPFKGHYVEWPSSLDNEDLNVFWTANRSNPGFDGYTVIYKRKLAYIDGPFYIYPETFNQDVTYKLTGSNLKVMKIIQGISKKELSLNSAGEFTDKVSGNETVKYFVYKSGDLKTLAQKNLLFERKAPPEALQNLVLGDGKVPEYLIITHDSLMNRALELKEYRQKINSLDVQVVRTQDIYRQYSSGRESPVAIRDFIRYVYAGYQSSSTPDSSLKYVLLFGDGNFDYRNMTAYFDDADVDPNALEPNYIPPYEKSKYSSDDFFSYLDFGENMHTAGPGIDVSLGRIPVSSDYEASAYLEKIKSYNDPAHFGPWRNTVVATADDDFQRSPNFCNIDPIGRGHTNDARIINEIILKEEPGKVTGNVYLLDYEHNYANAKPEAAQDLINKINRGALTFNYIGHGDSRVWADEGLLVTDKALPKMTNNDKTSVFTSFSCTVGRFEKLSEDGLSESFMAAPGIGAIATISATRESFVNPNLSLARQFYEHLFKRPDNNEAIAIGDALRTAKNNIGQSSLGSTFDFVNREKYGLFGEPVVTIRKAYLDINVKVKPDSISALDCGKLTGSVSGGSGNGFIHVDVFGQNSLKLVEGRECVEPNNRTSQDQYLDVNGSLLFSSTVPYKDGRFSMDYIFNERIPFGDTAAYIKFYAWDSQTPAEGTALVSDLNVKGAANTCEINNESGPSILISGCDREQTSMVDVESSIKFPIPYCLELVVIDSSGGVFITDRPDEGTTVEIWNLSDDKQESPPQQPRLSEDSFSRKSFTWDFDNSWSPGHYLLKVRAQDGFGNTTLRNIDVELVDDDFLNVYRVYNSPNPLKDEGTCFYFGGIGKPNVGSFVEEDANFRTNIKIYNQNGYLVRQLRDVGARGSFDETLSDCKNRGAWWDGRDSWGKMLANGFYYYKVFVRQNFATSSGQEDKLSTRKNTLLISR